MKPENKSQLSSFAFDLPKDLFAREPPEERGLTRDSVKLLAIERSSGKVTHARFQQLPSFLRKGDLLVFNSSRTIPASIEGWDLRTGVPIEVRLAEHLADGNWKALLVCRGGKPFDRPIGEGMTISFGKGFSCHVGKRDERIPRLWNINFSKAGQDLISALYSIGKPVHYEYLSSPWGLEYYQNVYSNQPGSLEMPSAGRAFTWKMLFELKRLGVESAFIVLHAGLSSYIDDELDFRHPVPEEEYFISENAARRINLARRRKHRVVAVGTTVVRALESVADVFGNVANVSAGYTRLKITEKHTLKAVDGLLTGLHEPEASHLELLSAFVRPQVLKRAYEEAVHRGYRWHEFGDLNLIS